ncbi:hypothetical protein [Kribbella sp. NBC_00359]|uniref:hypothetical protein n=1 Tax=Kribbella sp. NBC_00359 TaxID=2975966 RepID=UPI002E1A0926
MSEPARSSSANDRRIVVLVLPSTSTWAPPGRSPEAWRLALAEDTYEVLAALDRVEVAVAVLNGTEASLQEATALTWPGTPVYTAPTLYQALTQAATLTSAHTSTAIATPTSATASEAGESTSGTGRVAAVVAVAYDAPDLPGLLIGKLFRALSTADIAVCPAEDGSQVALGVNLPIANWLTDSLDLSLDLTLAELDHAKPRRHAVAVGPGWHRLRSPADLARLDPGLEGWDATRSILRHA